MKQPASLPALLLALGLALAGMVAAQDGPPMPGDGHGPREGHPPPRDPRVEAALDDCWNELGGEADDPVPPGLMDQCMDEKGFPRPPHGPHGAHGPHGPQPPPPGPDGLDGPDDPDGQDGPPLTPF